MRRRRRRSKQRKRRGGCSNRRIAHQSARPPPPAMMARTRTSRRRRFHPRRRRRCTISSGSCRLWLTRASLGVGLHHSAYALCFIHQLPLFNIARGTTPPGRSEQSKSCAVVHKHGRSCHATNCLCLSTSSTSSTNIMRPQRDAKDQASALKLSQRLDAEELAAQKSSKQRKRGREDEASSAAPPSALPQHRYRVGAEQSSRMRVMHTYILPRTQ